MATIQQARRGDLEAFNHLVLAYQDLVYNQAYRLLGEGQTAEDLTQEAFITAYLKLSLFRGGSFRAWLWRIVTNLCLDYFRKEKGHENVPLEPLNFEGEENDSPLWLADTGLGPEEIAERQDFWNLVQACLDQVHPKLRLALVLVDIQGMEYGEAAEILQVPVGTLKSRLARGRQKLSELWQRGAYPSYELAHL